jgi:hypothetical protein
MNRNRCRGVRKNMRKLATFQFVITVVLISVALYGIYRVALDMTSYGAAAYEVMSNKVVRLEAAIPTSLRAALTRPVKVKNYSKEELSTRVLVTFTAYKLLASDGKLVGDLSLTVPVPLKEEIEPRLSEIISCPEGKTGTKVHPKVDDEYADKNQLVSVLNETGSQSVKIPIPLEDFLSSSISSASETCKEKREDVISRPTEFRVPIELPVLAGPIREYPSDYHQLSANVQIKLPRGFSLSGATQEGVPGLGSSPPTLPHAIRIRSSQGMEGKTISLLKSGASLPLLRSIDAPRITATNFDSMANSSTAKSAVPSQDEVDLRLLVVRDSRTQYFVYAVAALLPPALLLALVLVPFSSGRVLDFKEVTVNIALATLAILPLRAVLVPPDLQVLTRVDYILVIQLEAIS